MAQLPSCPTASVQVPSVQVSSVQEKPTSSSSPLFPRFFSESTRRRTWLSESQEKQNMARRGQQLPLRSMEDVTAALNESDEDAGAAEPLSGNEGSAALSGDAASPATVSSDPSDSSEDEVLDEEEKQARSRDKGKGRALDVDATPAAMVGVMPQELPQPSHVAGDVGDAAHLRAYSADYADMAPGSDGDDGESAGTGAAKRQRTADSNGSRNFKRLQEGLRKHVDSAGKFVSAMTIAVRQDGAGNCIGGPFMVATPGVQAFGKEIMAGFLAAASATLLPTPVTAAVQVRSEDLPSGKAGGVTPSLIAMAAPAVRTLATPAPTMPVVDWSRVTVPRAGPVSVTMPVAKRARGTGNEPRRAQVVRTELRTYYTDCITHHRQMVIDFPSADMTRSGTRPLWWPTDMAFEVLGDLGCIADMQRVRAVLEEQRAYYDQVAATRAAPSAGAQTPPTAPTGGPTPPIAVVETPPTAPAVIETPPTAPAPVQAPPLVPVVPTAAVAPAAAGKAKPKPTPKAAKSTVTAAAAGSADAATAAIAPTAGAPEVVAPTAAVATPVIPAAAAAPPVAPAGSLTQAALAPAAADNGGRAAGSAGASGRTGRSRTPSAKAAEAAKPAPPGSG